MRELDPERGAFGKEGLAGLVDRDIGDAALAEEGLESALVMVAALRDGKA